MNNPYLYSVRNTVLSSKPSKPSKATRWLLLAFLLLAQTVAFGQITGDYRSNANGNWTTLTSWQYYNGTAWVTPSGTAPQGYPGEFAGTGTVTIRNNNTITLTTSITNLFTKLIIGDGASSGVFAVSADIANFNTLDIIINPSGNMNFTGQNELRLPANSGIKINAPGQIITTGNGTCTNNTAIYIGGVKFGVCKGAGNAEYTFDELNAFGGTLFSAPLSNTPVCQENSINLTGGYSGPTPTSITYSWSIKAPNNTVTASSTKDFSLPASQIGNYQATLTCNALYDTRPYSNSETITVTVNALPSAPTIGTITQPTCTLATGSVILNSLPTSGSWTLYQNGATIHAATGGTGTYTVSGLASGTYNFTVSNSTCTSAASTNVVINAVVTTTYNGSSWSSTPDLTKIGIINSNTPIAASADLCSCTVNAGINAVVASGVTLKLQDKLTVNGTLTFNDSASLVQINDVTNSGSIKYNRNYTGGEEDYTYWSSPVASQNLLALSPSTEFDKFFSFNGTAWVQETPSSTTMTIGKGYIIRGIPPPAGPPVGFGTLLFNGVPNNGDKSITVIGGESSNLIGNPYPSAIDADSFILANTGAIDGTLYFWTHNTPIAIGTPDPGTGVYAYSGNDYATYTLSGGVGTAGNLTAPEWVDANNNKIVDTGEWTDTNGNNIVDAVEWVDANNNKVVDSGEWTDSNGDNILNLEVEQVSNRPTGKIAAGQGFFTTSTTTGSLVTFTNAMRIDGSGNPLNNSNFYKTKNSKTKTATAFEKHRVWLNLSNTEGAFKQTLVGYITGATNTWDKLYDGVSFDGNDFLDFYSINEEKNLTIQGRALPFDENDEIPLGYRIAVEGNFTINIDETDGLLSRQEVFLEDKLTNKTVNLKEGNYTFNTAAGTFDDRFVLKYTNKTLSIDETDKEDGILVLYSNNYKTLIIHNNDLYSTVNSVALFNITGQNIANWEVNDFEQTNIQFPIKNISSGVYIVKVKTTKGESSKKIIIK